MTTSSINHEQFDDQNSIRPASTPAATDSSMRVNPSPSDGSNDSMENKAELESTTTTGTTVANVNTEPENTVATAATPTTKNSIFKNRYFMFLWIAQALSQTAQNTLNLALVEYVDTKSNHSPTQTSIETVAFVLPGVIFSALAGVFVDRFNKRATLVITNLLRAVLIPWLIFTNNLPLGLAIPIIFMITLLFSTISQFFGPAESSMIPLLVEPEQLTQANSLFQLTFFGAIFVGFSILAPILPAVIGHNNLFIALSVLYAGCTILVWLIPKNMEKHEDRPDETAKQLIGNVWQELIEGMSFIWHEKNVWLAIVYLSTVQAILFMLASVGIPFVGVKGLHLPESAIIFILAPLSIGLGVGVVLINRFVNTRNRNRVMIWATVALGINLAAIGMVKVVAVIWVAIFSPGVPIGGWGLITLIIMLSITFGFELSLLQIPALTMMQERSPKEIIGRVYAAYFTFTNLASILPILGVGALGDLIGLVPVFLIMGAGVLAIAYYARHLQPKLT